MATRGPPEIKVAATETLDGRDADNVDQFVAQGLIAVPPQHALEAQWLEVPRNAPRRLLDLDKLTDQRALIDSIGAPEYQELLEQQLPHYLRFFAGPEWRVVTQMGVTRQVGAKRWVALDMLYLAQITRALAGFEKAPGFESLVAGLANPPQLLSTLFEIEAAEFASTRKITRGMQFSKPATVGQKLKRPEFVWQTLLGDIVCECKRAEFTDSLFERRFQALFSSMKHVAGEEKDWPDDLRLDLDAQSGPRPAIEAEIVDAVRKAAATSKGGTARNFQYEGRLIRAEFRPRGRMPDLKPDTMRSGLSTVGPNGAHLSLSSWMALTMDLRQHLLKVTSKLATEARKQIPTNVVGGIFLDVGSLSAPVEKALALVGLPEYARTPLMLLFRRGQWQVVYRNAQPLDGRVTE